MEFCPDALQFKVSDCCKYLGIIVGPGENSSSWIAPRTKFLSAAMELKSRKPPLLALTRMYSSAVVTKMSHIKQVLPPSAAVYKTENYAVMAVTRTLHSSGSWRKKVRAT